MERKGSQEIWEVVDFFQEEPRGQFFTSAMI